MITEQYKDKVYFSKLLCTDCPNIYKDICEILDANNVAHETLSLTKDYWCRDYMPGYMQVSVSLNLYTIPTI